MMRPTGIALRWLISGLVVLGAAPSRTQTYTAGQIIDPADVTENEDNIYSYLQGGVDTIDDNAILTNHILNGTITTSDIASETLTTSNILDGTIGTADLATGGVATADIASNAVDGTKLAIGSDAQGDVLYYDGTDYTRLGAGTTGQLLKTQGAAANPAWGAITSSAFTFSRTAAAGSGAQTVAHGLGYDPGAYVVFCTNASDDASWGVGDSADAEQAIAAVDISGSAFAVAASTFISVTTGSDSMTAVLTSDDATNVTITWTKGNSGTNVTCQALAW